ncbi:MAG: protein kinase, partial [Planctomycetes bacterium]|nr:protein kinase [Planctomycetota bacterium]
MTTPCPDIAEIRRYVASGAVEDSPTAEHVRSCDSCREILIQLETASTGVETVEATQSDPSATRTLTDEQRTAAAPLPDRVGAVEVGEAIGRGGMGVVHRGRDRMLSRDVAVKFLLNVVAGEGDPRFEEFLGGARNAAKVRHPNLVTMHQACLVEQTPCLIMELIDGPTLGRLIHDHGPLSPTVALRILDDTASAVAALHEHDVLHRDIKPGNILFDREGRLFVTDFGLTCARPSGFDEAHRARKIAGSPPYMAPEMFQGTISTRTDVYALGVVAFELLTGKLPFEGPLPEVQRAHESTPPPLDELRSAKVPSGMVDLIERAMHKREIYRFKSAIEFRRALREVDETRAPDVVIRQLVQAKPADRHASKTEAQPTTGGSSSYFDRLTEIASEKQAARGEVPPPHHALSDEDEETRIAGRLPCSGCGRDLFDERLAGACPRCHTPIEESRDAHMLSSASRPVLQRLGRGLGRVRLALSIGLVGLVGVALARVGLDVLFPTM